MTQDEICIRIKEIADNLDNSLVDNPDEYAGHMIDAALELNKLHNAMFDNNMKIEEATTKVLEVQNG